MGGLVNPPPLSDRLELSSFFSSCILDSSWHDQTSDKLTNALMEHIRRVTLGSEDHEAGAEETYLGTKKVDVVGMRNKCDIKMKFSSKLKPSYRHRDTAF